MPPRVIHTAQALIDEVVEVLGLPPRGGNAMANSYRRYAGGAVNILLAAARQGAHAVHAGSVGEGPNGDRVRKALVSEGVEVSSPMVQGIDTGICFVMVEPSGERTFVTTLGAERRISVDSLDTSAPQPGDLVCVSGYSLFGATRDPLMAWLESLPEGVEVVFDPGAAFASLGEACRERVLACTTVWTSNADEARELVDVVDMEQAARAIAERLPGVAVIVRDGDRGCAVSVDGVTTAVPGYPMEAVDTNGAGDCHTGILCAERALGMGWVEAARRANAGAALKVTRRGPATAPRRGEIDAVLAAVPR